MYVASFKWRPSAYRIGDHMTVKLSLNSMRFGSEEDFDTAITELRWITKTYGKSRKSDFERISSKYLFPTEFLQLGLKGLSRDDYRISKSKWFPILYSWKNQRRDVSYKLLSLQIDYKSTKFSVIRNTAVFIGICQIIILLLSTNFALDSLDLSLLVLTFGLFLTEWLSQMIGRLSEKRVALDEYCHILQQKGLGRIIEENERFLKTVQKFVIHAGSILKKKLASPLEMTIFESHLVNGTLVLDDWEDPNREYEKRISELEKQRKE